MEVSIENSIPADAAACEDILRSLPEWFGVDAAIRAYRRDIENMATYVAKHNDKIVGFVTIKLHNSQSAEIQVLGIRKEYHRMGIGRSLISKSESWLDQRRVKFLQVKTLGPSRRSKPYEGTRSFFEAMGFAPLEETASIWGKENPCLIMLKCVSN